MIRALFICSANQLRSPTAEQVFARWPGVETDSAGLNANARVRLSPEQLEWADLIFVMEQHHKDKLLREFKAHLRDKRVVCLGIPDEFELMAPALIALLESKAGPHLRRRR